MNILYLFLLILLIIYINNINVNNEYFTIGMRECNQTDNINNYSIAELYQLLELKKSATSKEIKRRTDKYIEKYTKELALKLNIIGLINIQFALKDNIIY